MRALFLALSLLGTPLLAACPGPIAPPPAEEQEVKLAVVVRDDLTTADVLIESPVTLSAIQAVLVFDPAKGQLSSARAGENGPITARVFDDGGRVPGRFLVGVSDLNQNPLPRRGVLLTVELAKTLPDLAISVEGVVAVDLQGEKVNVEAP